MRYEVFFGKKHKNVEILIDFDHFSGIFWGIIMGKPLIYIAFILIQQALFTLFKVF